MNSERGTPNSGLGPTRLRRDGLGIGLVIYGSLDNISGGYLYDRKIVEGLRARGAVVEVLSLPWRNYGRHLCDNLSPALCRMVQERRWDVLLQDELNHSSLLRLNLRLRKAALCPVIAIVHHLRCCEFRSRWLNRFYGAVEKKYLDTIQGFIFNSATTRSVVRKIIKRDTPSVIAYPGRDHLDFGVTPEIFPERSNRADPLRVLYLGNIIPRKGLQVLIEALALLPRGRWRLTAAGDQEIDSGYFGKIVDKVAAAGLEDLVAFPGRVPQDAVADLFASCDCLVLPSFYEGFGIAPLEAMGFGRPVIASTAGAGPEWIRHGVEGWLVSPGDSGALAHYLERWMNNRELLIRMGQAALKKYSAHPTWTESAAEVDVFIRRMIRSAPAFPPGPRSAGPSFSVRSV